MTEPAPAAAEPRRSLRPVVHTVASVVFVLAAVVILLLVASGLDAMLAAFAAESGIFERPFGAWSFGYLADVAGLFLAMIAREVEANVSLTLGSVAFVAGGVMLVTRGR